MEKREIKFRAWDNKNLWWCRYTNSDCMNNLQNKNVNIMQYTWLQDKNWVDIYEWDIVKRYWVAFSWSREERDKASKKVVSISEIKWDNEELFFSIDWNEKLGIYNWYNCLKVVGNIYENKDLLNEN